jgi:hypothetical protein
VMADPWLFNVSYPMVARVLALEAEVADRRAEVERLRARIHEAVDDCQRRYAPYQKRCDRFDAIAKWARAEFGQAPWNDQHSWWSLTSAMARTLITSIIEERDAALAQIEALKGARLISVIFGHHKGAPRPFALHQGREREPAYLGTQWLDGYVVVRPGPSGGVMPWRSIDAALADFAASGQDLRVVWLSDELESLAEMEQQRDAALAELAAVNATIAEVREAAEDHRGCECSAGSEIMALLDGPDTEEATDDRP